jgi:hypothetical protein
MFKRIAAFAYGDDNPRSDGQDQFAGYRCKAENQIGIASGFQMTIGAIIENRSDYYLGFPDDQR